MKAASLLKPKLYDRQDPALILNGGECDDCGYVFFPIQRYGCERCGAVGECLQPRQLAAQGTLMASTVVHIHHSESRPVPFVVASIKLDAGPFIRTLLEYSAAAEPLAPGTALEGVLSTVINSAEAPSQKALVDLRFKPV